MTYFAGVDVSLRSTNICVVNVTVESITAYSTTFEG